MVKVVSETIDITPSKPTYMAGYFTRDEKFKGVHDSIEAIITWLEVDGQKNFFAALDLSNLDYEFVRQIKQGIIEKCPVLETNIIISATHNHAGPVIVTRNANQPVDPDYRAYVIRAVVETAVSLCGKERKAEKVVYTHGLSSGYYGNRNSTLKYGDNHIYMLEFRDGENKNLSAIINLSCHASVLGQEQYELSGDLFAALRRKMTGALGITPMVINGCAGDMSNRLYRQSNDYREVERISMGIAAQILNFSEKQEIVLTAEKVSSFVFHTKNDIDTEAFQEKAKRLREQMQAESEYEKRKVLSSKIKACERKIENPHVDLTFQTTVIRMQDLEIVVIPGEMSAALGRQIKESSAAKCCMVWGYANGLTGYVVASTEFNDGMEGLSTLLKKGAAEEYVGKILQHMSE